MSVISASQQKMATATGAGFVPVAKRTQKHEINPNVDPNKAPLLTMERRGFGDVSSASA